MYRAAAGKLQQARNRQDDRNSRNGDVDTRPGGTAAYNRPPAFCFTLARRLWGCLGQSNVTSDDRFRVHTVATPVTDPFEAYAYCSASSMSEDSSLVPVSSRSVDNAEDGILGLNDRGLICLVSAKLVRMLQRVTRRTSSDGDQIVILADMDVGTSLDSQPRDGRAPKFPASAWSLGVLFGATHLAPMIRGKADRGRPVSRPTWVAVLAFSTAVSRIETSLSRISSLPRTAQSISLSSPSW